MCQLPDLVSTAWLFSPKAMSKNESATGNLDPRQLGQIVREPEVQTQTSEHHSHLLCLSQSLTMTTRAVNMASPNGVLGSCADDELRIQN